MSFLQNLTAFLPARKKGPDLEYYFALNIGAEKITSALWTVEGNKLKILDTSSLNYSSLEDLISVTDKLLDQVLGLKEIEPQKILFGVPNNWLSDENLKDEYLKLLRGLVKELELTPMAYVATSQALVHFLEKQESVPATAILVSFDKEHLAVTAARAGKVDGVKVVKRGESAGSDIEKALLTFTDIETLPSKILIYGEQAAELKNELLSFSWMSKLSFLHFPKIEVLDEDINIKSVCLAGGSEINSNTTYTEHSYKKETEKEAKSASFGFMVGDVAKEGQRSKVKDQNGGSIDGVQEPHETGINSFEEHTLETGDFEKDLPPSETLPVNHQPKFNIKGLIPKNFTLLPILIGATGIAVLVLGAYFYLVKAEIKVFVEPKVLEKDAQVIADPVQKAVNEEAKIIPGQIVETEVSGTAKDSASGKKQIGDPAKGTIKLYNKTFESISLSKGTQISGPYGTKFTLDTSINIASASASDSGISYGKPPSNPTATASVIGADGNLPSGSNVTISGYSSDQLTAQAEGNFSGGTSKDVTVVSSEDAQRLLAKLSSDLRKQAQQKLQEQYPEKKVLEEALSENIAKKTYSKNINDQASEFSLNMTDKFKGTAFNDADLRTIVAKLVNTEVPDGFELNIADTETQADVSKLEKDGKLIFLAKFRAKMLPKVDSNKIKNQIKFKTPAEAENLLKGMDNILASEIKITPGLPAFLSRLPLLSENIYIEVGLK